MLRVVKTANGLVEGIPAADPRVTAFKGIPFAAPPVGEYRWKKPMPAENWEGIRECYDFAPISMQAIPGLNKENIYSREWNVDPDIPMSEDCLHLNVWTNAKTGDEKMPVLVWFFGGGLQVGNTAEMEFDGERIARRDIVVVTVNYRVNVFGFLTTKELAEHDPKAPANWGALDQQAGLKWVQENIEAFGGNPNKVTIAGQSAGGGSVMTHLTSPQSDGLFHQVIVESGVSKGVYVDMSRGRSFEEAIEKGEKFLKILGVENIAQARELSAEFIRDKYLESKMTFGTIYDGVFSEGEPYALYMQGKKQRVPMLAGFTADEFKQIFPMQESEEAYIKATEEIFGDKAQRFREICDADTLEGKIKNSTSRQIETALRSMFERNNGEDNNYMYLFDTEIPGWDNPGNFHSVDLWFFFETLAKCWRPFKGRHYDQSRMMCNYWANYIKTGNPNGEEMPKWEKYTVDNPNYIIFSDKGIKMEDKPVDKLTRFLTEILKERY